MTPYELLTKLLQLIENRLMEKTNIPMYSKELSISSVHLQRLFQAAFQMPLKQYILLRKLSSSTQELLQSQYTILQIATMYGFLHEQSYIRAFKKVFLMTPGKYRHEKPILPLTPPLSLLNVKTIEDGVLFGPSIVALAAIPVAGKRYEIPFVDAIEMAPKVALDFFLQERNRIVHSVCNTTYYGVTRMLGNDYSSLYLPSIEVSSYQGNEEFDKDCIPAGNYIRFHYIGKHHYSLLNAKIARAMYELKDKYIFDHPSVSQKVDKSFFFERVDSQTYNDEYCVLEWFMPINMESK